MALVFVVTTRIVSAQSRDRAAAELEVARSSFSNLVDERTSAAIGEAELITQLPVFRAHLTDGQLAENRANVQAMANGYREQLHAQFAIVARQAGSWAADPGWQGAPAAAGSRLHGAIAAALAGSSTGEIISHERRVLPHRVRPGALRRRNPRLADARISPDERARAAARPPRGM